MTKKKETSAEKHAREVNRPTVHERAEIIIDELRGEQYHSEQIWDIGREVSKIVFPHVGWDKRLGKLLSPAHSNKVKDAGHHFSSDDSKPPKICIQECFPPYSQEAHPVEIGTEIYDNCKYLGTVYEVVRNKRGIITGYRLNKKRLITPDKIYSEDELRPGKLNPWEERE